MTAPIDLVKQYVEACGSKDVDTMGSLLHDSFTFAGPCMSFNSKEEMLGFMSQCPFECKHENTTFISEGAKVVQIFDWVVTKPFELTTRMCEVMTVEDGKIRSAELFYDSAKFPTEFMEQMKEQQEA